MLAIRGSLFVLFIVFSIAGHATSKTICPPPFTSPDPETIKIAALNAKDHGFLWSISKYGHTSYLYGTIHVGKLDWMFPGPIVKQAIGSSDTIALEMDPLNEDIQIRIKKAITASRSNAIPDSLVNQIKQLAESECVPYKTLAGMTPEFQVTTLQILHTRRDQFETAYGIDSVLAGLGHALKKTLVSLETPEMQIDLLQMKSQEGTIAFVKEGLAQIKSGRSRAIMQRLSEIWIGSDYEDLSHYLAWCECQKNKFEEEFMKRALDDRNPNLARDIDALHKNGKQVFAAVGSLHMVGRQGLPELMAHRGYKVERVIFQQKAQSRLRLQEP